MAIVTMKKLTLLAMQSNKESIFNALIRTKSVELKRSADIEACTRFDMASAREKVAEKIKRVEDSIAYVAEQTDNYNGAHKRDKTVKAVELPKNGFARPLTEIDFDFFLNFGANAERIEDDLFKLAEIRAELAQNEATLIQKKGELQRLKLIEKLPHPTTWYNSTETSTVALMQLNASQLNKFEEFASNYELVNVETVDVVDGVALVIVIAHKSETEFFEQAVTYGLVKCTVACDVLPKVAIEDLTKQIAALKERNAELVKNVANYAPNTAEWKIYIDYLSLNDAKLSAESDLSSTASTFVLEAYYPLDAEEKVVKAIEKVTSHCELTLSDIGEDEFAPTLIKSNKVVKPFESITNMYSPPAYHEVDPNPVMSVFYFIIFGFMVADIGYGLLLFIAGLVGTFLIKQRTGLKTMLQLFGMCGLSAIVVGALFGSVFCYSTGADGLNIYNGPIPAPDQYPMVMMMLSLALGIIHICAGIGCKMAVKIKHKQHLAAWLADFPWIIMFVSLIVAIFNMALDMAAYEPWANVRLPKLATQIALYVCLGSLAIGVIFAGLGKKGILSKFTSGFGSVYGLINYFGDIMSYIRVFGLMLSSALVGSVFNEIGKMVAGDGGVGYVLAGLLLVFMHIFNLAMGVLSVYIHNGRLQYVEFFGKFYEGDGELFKAFGDITKYTLIKDE